MKKKILVAIIAIGALVPVILIGGRLVQILSALLAGIAFYEMSILKDSHNKYPILIKALGLLCLEFLVLFKTNQSYIYYGLPFLGMGATALLLGIPAIFDKKGDYTTKDFFYLFGSIAYLGIFFNLMILVFNADKWIFIYLLLIATLTDTFAMFIGCMIGKHKLIPNVSPKKSYEGSIAGSIVGTICPAILYYYKVTSDISIPLLIAMTFGLSLLAQLGDLFFSKIKRENQTKDFSNIMPGHGGVLDRLDSFSFVIIGYIIIINIIHMIRMWGT